MIYSPAHFQVEDKEKVLEFLRLCMRTLVRGVPTWNYSTAIIKDFFDKEFVRNLSKGIIGIKIEVKEIQSKFKLC